MKELQQAQAQLNNTRIEILKDVTERLLVLNAAGVEVNTELAHINSVIISLRTENERLLK